MRDDAQMFVRHIKKEEKAIKKQRYRCLFTHNKKHRYRYFLECCWDENKPQIVWIGLNPSVANQYKLDATLYRVLYYSHKWNFGSFVILNAFAQVDSDPRNLDRVKGVGIANDLWIKEYLANCSTVLCAWSNCWRRRQNELARMMGVDCRGYPLHPSRKCNVLEKHKMHFIEDCKGNLLSVT